MNQNGKLVSVKKTLLLRKTAKNGQMSETKKIFYKKNLAWDVANNRNVDCLQKNLQKFKKFKTEKNAHQ